ncbi:hypothetical protein VPH35_110894 [Triticum aestivum]
MAAVKHLMLGVLSSYQWTTAARHSELGVLSSYQRMAAARHSELGVLSSYQRMAAARHLELGVLSSYQETAIVRHPELSCIVLNRIGRRLLGQRKRKNAMETRWLTFGGFDSSLVPARIGEEAIKFLQQVPLLDLCS